MTLQNTDLFIVERGSQQYQMTADQIADFLGAVRDFTASNIVGRDALADLQIGDRVFVTDATADSTVEAGWAIYRVSTTGPITFDKIQEQESMDMSVVASVDLSFAASPTGGTVNNSAGNNAIIPVVNATNAGLATPSMLANSHVAASASGTASTNPVVVDGPSQGISLNISQLLPLP